MSGRRNRHLGPTRLAAAWVVFGGGLAGLALAAVFLPMPAPPDRAFVVDLPAQPDRYAAVGVQGLGGAPEVNPEAVQAIAAPLIAMAGGEEAASNSQTPPKPTESSQAEAATVEPPVASAAPRLALTPAIERAGVLKLDRPGAPLPPDDPNGDIVITVQGVPETAARVGPLPPDPALMAGTAAARRPAIAKDGRTPFETYRRYDSRLPTAPSKNFAIMVSGLGLDTALTADAIARLPPEVTLSFAPYSRDLPLWIERAVKKGHEVVIEIPMEEAGVPAQALGSAALRTNAGIAANEKRLEWILSRSPAYPMVTNYLGESFVENPDALRPVLAKVREAGLAYLDDTGRARTLAMSMDVPYGAVATVVPPGASDIAGRVANAAAAAGPVPSAIKVYAAGGGLEGVLDWVQSDPRRNVTLVPASEVVTP